MLTREEYEAKRQARYDRLIAAAERAEREGAASRKAGQMMFDCIPFGQPILVGHYSEGRDRRFRERARNKITKGYELYTKAQEYRSRAEAVEKNNSIMSDDPDAVEKIEDKIARLEKRQEFMKACNKLVRKNDRAGLAKMGLSETAINRLFTPDFCGRVGFADHEIKNNNANIRRLKERAQVVARKQEADDKTEEIDGVKIEYCPSENRIRIDFGGRVEYELYKKLKAHGFRVLRSAGEGVFSAYHNNNALYFVKTYLKTA